MKTIIMHQTVTKHDAIGNDIEAMYFLLNENNYECVVYAENKQNDKVRYIDIAELDQQIKMRENIIIYHHSVNWSSGYEILKRADCRIVFRYHNITPPHFFENYNIFHYQQCREGRKLTTKLLKEFSDSMWISASKYNVSDLKGISNKQIFVCPPFHKIEQWTKNMPDETILAKLLESEAINILFVGRVVPNKGHLFLLEILRIFRLNYNKEIKLHIIGKFDDGLATYNELITQKIEEYYLQDSIEFIGEINDSSLLSYYLGCDIMVCVSEHEGFCVPIIEAQYNRLPIIALNECAVPETIGKNQLVLEKNAGDFAAAIKVIYDLPEYQKYLIEYGMKNYEQRFSNQKISKTFLEIMKHEVMK